MKNKKRNWDDSFIFTNPDYTLFKEAYVRLKDSLYFCSNGGEKKVIQIESSIPNEAKTLTAINLACAIAEDNKKVLLVDLDLHRGVMHRTFEIENVNGITDLVKNGFEIGGGFYTYYNGTRMLMTAKTARQIICAFAKRTLGWVGIAWVIYDFSECMNKK